MTGRVSVLVNVQLALGYAQAAVELGEPELTRLAGSRDGWSRFLAQTNQVSALLALNETQRARPLLINALRLLPAT